MKNRISEEFHTVELLLCSDAETRAVDAFTITWVKLEKQLRRLTTNLIFQHSAFGGGKNDDKATLRKAILAKRTANHIRFIGAIRRLSGHSVGELIGDRYKPLKKEIDTSYKHRNKIFHGQQTGHSLARSDLEALIGSMREWCELLADGAQAELGYDGFTKAALSKNDNEEITRSVDKAMADGWERFVAGI